MYESLDKYCNDYHLYIFAFDDKTYEILNKLNLKNVTVISLNEFENEELLSVKGDRTAGEYCWTSTPYTIYHCITRYNLENCTYLDADIYFFSNPELLFKEMGDKSVLITDHRYTPKYDMSSESGKYCVQFMFFKNDKDGMEVLNWWKNACLDWCYARAEDGKFGDQKYLDDWPERFPGVHELEYLGGGLAPWNIQQYRIYNANGNVKGIEKKTNISFDAIFYHFHRLKFLTNGKVDLCPFELDKNVIHKIYVPYLKHITSISNKIKLMDNSIDPDGKSDFINVKKMKDFLIWVYDFLRITFKKGYNVYKLDDLLLIDEE